MNEEISLNPTTSRNIQSIQEVTERLAASAAYQIVGTAVEVNGNRVAVLRTERDAQEVVWRLQAPFLRPGMSQADYHSVEFVEDVRLVPTPVDEQSITNIEYVIHRLEGRTLVIEEYIVQSGDNLGSIALRHNTTLAQLYEDNPNISAATILRVGDVIRIQSYRPNLTVRTVEEETRREPIPIDNQYVENPVEHSGFRYIIQEGVEGVQEVVVHIVRTNGVQTGPEEIISTREIEPMISNIVEVGVS